MTTAMQVDEEGEEVRKGSEGEWEGYVLDCYPHSFSPLLLFSDEGYFDKGDDLVEI